MRSQKCCTVAILAVMVWLGVLTDASMSVSAGTLRQVATPRPTATNISSLNAGAAIKIGGDTNHSDLSPTWSADSQSVLYYTESTSDNKGYTTTFYRINLAKPNDPQLLMELDGSTQIYAATWSPDEKYIAYLTTNSAGSLLNVIDAKGKFVGRYVNPEASNSFAGVAWSPDGSRLLIWQHEALFVVGLANWQAVKLGVPDNSRVRGAAWSPDGNTILAVILGKPDFPDRGDIYSFDAKGGSAGQVLTHSDADNTDPAWSPVGSKIAFRSDDHLYVMQKDGFELKRLTDTLYGDSCPQWSPDGSKIGFLRTDAIDGRTLFLMDVATSAMAWLDRSDGNPDSCVQWSPDGKWLLFQTVSEILPGETVPGVSIDVAALSSFKSDPLAATLLYRVAFVSPNDTLNVRAQAGAQSAVVDKLQPEEYVQLADPSRKVKVDDGTLWVPITYHGGKTGWVNREYLVGGLDSTVFCRDPRPKALVAALQDAVRNHDGDKFANLVGPRGLYLSFGAPFHLNASDLRNIFNDHTPRNFGGGQYAAPNQAKSLADVTGIMQRDMLPDNITVACNDNQDDLSDRITLYALPELGYTITDFYSIQRPGPPGDDLSWGAWGLSIEYWDGQPVLNALSYYEWTP